MGGETQWNKKIDFSPKEETIAESSKRDLRKLMKWSRN